MNPGPVSYALLGAVLGGVGTVGGFIVGAFFVDWRRARRTRLRLAARDRFRALTGASS